MLSAVVDLLACPVCQSSMATDDAVVACADGHAFDVARQGYVMLTASPIRHGGDTAAMVAARERVQQVGLLSAITDAVVAAVPEETGTLLDVGAGTGHHTAAVMRARSGCRGVAVDSAKPALRRAGRAHPRIGAVGADVVDSLPVRDGSIDCLLVTFAPRNVRVFTRVLNREGHIVVVTPRGAHLRGVAGPMGLLNIEEDKWARLVALMSPMLEVCTTRTVTTTVEVSRDQAVDLALMGPAGFHADLDVLRGRADTLSLTTTTTVAVDVTTFCSRQR